MKFVSRGCGLVVLAAAAFLATGCSKVLDWRNAEVSSGKIFRDGADEPFSGELTSIPDAKVVYSAGYLALVRQIDDLAATAGKVKTLGSVCTAKVKKGVLDGAVTCEDQTKQMQVEMNLEDGVPNGSFVLLNRGKKIMTATFKDGMPHGEQEIFSPKTERLVFRAYWEDGLMNGEKSAYMEDTGVKVSSHQYSKGRMHGLAVQYAADGKRVIGRGTFEQGRQIGLEEMFDPQTGTKLSEKTFVNGQVQGEAKRWDASGTLIEHMMHPADGPPRNLLRAAAQPSVDPSVCVDQWIAAHRKEAGPDAPVRHDVLEEWKEECQAGRLPK